MTCKRCSTYFIVTFSLTVCLLFRSKCTHTCICMCTYICTTTTTNFSPFNNVEMKKLTQCHIVTFYDQVAGIWDQASGDWPLWVEKLYYRTVYWLMSGAPDFCIAWFPSHAHYTAGHWPGRGSPTKTFKVVVIDMQRVRLVVRVAYPLTGTLLLISHSSADCISTVRNLLSHPRGVYVIGACGSICLPSV